MYDEGYIRYTHIRNLAWKLLLKHEVRSLPVDARALAEASDVRVMRYGDAEALIEACGLEKVQRENRAFSVYTDCWRILYDDNSRAPMFAIAHELAHILLKHPMKQKKVGFFTAHYTDYNQGSVTFLADEQDADKFAVRLLAPACILHRLKMADTETIAELCGLPRRDAYERSERLKQLVQRNHFFSHKDEEEVYDQFYPYMEKNPEFFSV